MDLCSPPPQYSRLSGQVPGRPLSSDSLPAYSRRRRSEIPAAHHRREPTEHVFKLSEGKSKDNAWLKLTLLSSAKSSRSLPTYFEKDSIVGKLELTAERGDNIQAVTAFISGRVNVGSASQEAFVFLDETITIWSKSLDVPRVPSPSEGASSTKLLGHCEWPLSFAIPRTVELPSANGTMASYRLPETFLERHSTASIQYDLSIVVSRGKLRSDNLLKTAFGYVPQSRPEPHSMLRQFVYREGLPMPAPSADPAGWKTLRPVAVRGVMQKTRSVEARCALSIGRPLCYTRGSVIPCFITLEGRESAVLDALSSTNAIMVKLRRRVRLLRKSSSSKKETPWTDTVEDVGSAVWWQPHQNVDERHSRNLEGEIQLSKDLRPTSELPNFSVSYAIVLCQFKASNFTSDETTLLSEPVEIATMYGKGPRPKVYAPPAYDPARSSDERSRSSMEDCAPVFPIYTVPFLS